MARPIKNRRICSLPEVRYFGPRDHETAAGDVIRLYLDEYETLRLIDLGGLSQDVCAQRMGIARTTVTGIYNSARRKLAEALVQGRALEIDGGSYELCRLHGCDCGCLEGGSCGCIETGSCSCHEEK